MEPTRKMNARNWLISYPEEIFSFLFILYIISVKISRTEVLGEKAQIHFSRGALPAPLKKFPNSFSKKLLIYLGGINNAIIFLKVSIIKLILFIKIERSCSKNIQHRLKISGTKFIWMNYYDRTIRLEAKTSGYPKLPPHLCDSL